MGTDIPYDLEALKQGLKKCDANIVVFERAIEHEHETKKQFRRMIAVLEEKLEREG